MAERAVTLRDGGLLYSPTWFAAKFGTASHEIKKECDSCIQAVRKDEGLSKREASVIICRTKDPFSGTNEGTYKAMVGRCGVKDGNLIKFGIRMDGYKKEVA